jgi:hypothetical protein
VDHIVIFKDRLFLKIDILIKMAVILERTKILVYDKSGVFLRYFTKGISDCDFTAFSGTEGADFSLYDYNLILFVADNEINLNEFFKILNSRVQILFASSLKKKPKDIKELKNWFDIKFININGTKKEVIDQLRFHLNQYSKNKLDARVCI